MPKHIKVELDFIPVDERLPDDDRDLLVHRVHLPSGNETIMQATFLDGVSVWEDITGMTCTNNDYVVTHWAEIPDLTNNNE